MDYINLFNKVVYITELYQVLVIWWPSNNLNIEFISWLKFKKANFQNEMKINNAWNKFKQQI